MPTNDAATGVQDSSMIVLVYIYIYIYIYITQNSYKYLVPGHWK